jgi:hypothetical protein
MACKGGLRVMALSREDDDTGPYADKLWLERYRKLEEQGLLGVPRQVAADDCMVSMCVFLHAMLHLQRCCLAVPVCGRKSKAVAKP